MAIGVVPPAADVHARNEGRSERVVPRDVVDRHLRRVAELGGTPGDVIATLLAEGFARVRLLATTIELETVRIERRTVR